MRSLIKYVAIATSIVAISSCGSNGSGASSSGGGVNPVPSSTMEVVLGNISTIPLNGGPSKTYVVLTNNLSNRVTLLSATYTLYKNGVAQAPQSTNSANSPVTTSLCTSIAAKGTCSVQVSAPISSGTGQYLLNMNFIDNNTSKSYSTQQIISYSSAVPQTTSGVVYSTNNNNLYNVINGKNTLSIPFLLTQSFSNLSAVSSNPSFTPTINCPNNSYSSGNLCTLTVVATDTNTTNKIMGSISIYSGAAILQSQGVSRSSFYNIADMTRMISDATSLAEDNGYLFGFPVTVSQNLVGNLVTSAINPVINPSDGANPQTITLLNNGGGDVVIKSIVAGSPVVLASDTCTGATLGSSSNTTCTFNVNATETTSGQSTVLVYYNTESGTGVVSFNVVYIADTPGPAMTMTSGQGGLVGILINDVAYYSILVANTGDTDFESVTFTDPSDINSYMSWDSTSTCATDGSLSLASGSSCTLVLKYAPTNTEAETSITIREGATYTSQGGETSSYASASLAVSYSAVDSYAFLYITPNYVSYAIRADDNDYTTQTFYVINTGGESAINFSYTIESAAVTDYAETGGTCSGLTELGPDGESCTVIVKFGPTTTQMSDVTSQMLVSYYEYSEATSATTAFSNLVFNSSDAAYISISDITESGSSSGSGTSLSPYQFTNSPESQIDFVITYTNSGTQSATNFNVALNDLPVGYEVVTGSNTTCGYGADTSTLAVDASCSIEFRAMGSSSIYNPYSISGSLNIAIPGYSYVDANTGLNTETAPTYGGSDTIYVTANLFASVSESMTASPVATAWTTGTSGGSNNLTFVGTDDVYVYIPSSQLSGFTVGSGCTISSGSCTISVTNSSSTPLTTYYFTYIVTPSSSYTSGIIQQGYFTYTN